MGNGFQFQKGFFAQGSYRVSFFIYYYSSLLKALSRMEGKMGSGKRETPGKQRWGTFESARHRLANLSLGQFARHRLVNLGLAIRRIYLCHKRGIFTKPRFPNGGSDLAFSCQLFALGRKEWAGPASFQSSSSGIRFRKRSSQCIFSFFVGVSEWGTGLNFKKDFPGKVPIAFYI